jgi:ATP-dependent RNA helicase RhlE
VADQLTRAGYKVAALQGNMSQYQRQAAIEGFRDGSLKILVATDIAARGLDILSISHVINYDMPDTTDAYTHRIGRTGRINNSGEAYTLVTGEDKDMIKALERIFKKPIETRKIEGFDYDVEAKTMPIQTVRRPRPAVAARSEERSFNQPSRSTSRRSHAWSGKPGNDSVQPSGRKFRGENRVPRQRPANRERVSSR